MVMIMIIVN